MVKALFCSLCVKLFFFFFFTGKCKMERDRELTVMFLSVSEGMFFYIQESKDEGVTAK